MVTTIDALDRQPLAPAALAERARAVRLVLTDCDGVLTDGGVYYSTEGEALKRFSVRDGMGVERLRLAGIGTAIVTREDSDLVAARAVKLGVVFLFAGVKDKGSHLDVISRETGLDPAEMAYIGDDVNDVDILGAVGGRGLTGAPCDAMPEAAMEAHYRCSLPGGHGAFREFAEWILKLREEA